MTEPKSYLIPETLRGHLMAIIGEVPAKMGARALVALHEMKAHVGDDLSGHHPLMEENARLQDEIKRLNAEIKLEKDAERQLRLARSSVASLQELGDAQREEIKRLEAELFKAKRPLEAAGLVSRDPEGDYDESFVKENPKE